MTVAVTGVGSLPGVDARDYAEAVSLVFGELTLPHVPELPGRGAAASMTGRTLAMITELGADLQPAGWRLTGGGGGIDQRRARSLLAQDLDEVEAQGQEYVGPLKVQAAGPWTLAASVELPRGDKVLADRGARRDLALGLAEALAGHLADVRRRVPGAEILLQIDEPALPAVLAGAVPTASGFHRHRSVDAPAAAPAFEALVAVAHGAGVQAIVHCCAPNVPFDLFGSVGFDGVGVDLDQVDAPGYDALAGLLESGALVHLGVLPTSGTLPEAAQVASRVERFLDTVGLEPTPGLAIAPACGLAGLAPVRARAVLDVLSRAGRTL